MKKLSIFLIPLLVISMVFAQSETGDWKTRTRVGILGNLNTYLAFMDDNDNGGILSPGVGGFLDYQMGKFFALNLSMAYDQVKIDYPSVLTNNIMSLGLNGKIYPLPALNFKPHLKLGFSVMNFSQENGYFTDSKTSSFLTMGLGAEIPINKRLDIIAAVDHNITQEDIDHLPNKEQFLDDEFVSVSLGISYRLGVVKEKEEAPEPIRIEKPEQEEIVEEEVEEIVEEKVEEIVEKKVEEEVEEEVEEVEEIEIVEEPAKTHFESLDYMIKPGDYLIKIADKAYGDKLMWKEIYKWNKAEVGSDPDLIYPFYPLKLKDVPVENIPELNYSFYEYEVKSGETLDDIAAKEYGNPYAWVIIIRDNVDVLGDRYTVPTTGTIIKLRTKVFNEE